MKKDRIIFRITTSVIFIFEGLLTALTSQSKETKEAISHLGYPSYFGIMLTVFKVAGALALIIPKIPGRIKEWAYAGFGIDFIAALVSIWAVDGAGVTLLFPVIAFIILAVSYIYYHRLKLSVVR